MIFRREISAACSALVRLHHLAQRAVDAKAHRARALVGLDVDVARAVLRRLRQQRVEHADDRRVVARPRAGLRSPAAPASCATGRPRSRPRRSRPPRSTRRRRRPRRCGWPASSADSRSKRVDVVQAQHFARAPAGATVSGAHRTRRAPSSSSSSGVRLGEGVGQGMAGAHGAQLPGADAGAAPGAAGDPARRRRRRAPAAHAAAAVVRARSAARRAAGVLGARQRRQHRRLVDRQEQARLRLHRPAGTRGSGRSGRARACSWSSASRMHDRAQEDHQVGALLGRGSRCGTARRGTGMSPSSGTFDLLSV